MDDENENRTDRLGASPTAFLLGTCEISFIIVSFSFPYVLTTALWTRDFPRKAVEISACRVTSTQKKSPPKRAFLRNAERLTAPT
jgi:hypothetical protein